MKLLQQLWTEANQLDADVPAVVDKYSPQPITAVVKAVVKEGVDDIIDVGADYVPKMKRDPSKTKKRKQPTTDRAQQSLINTLWFYNNSDAS